jgi:ABC-type methionine transport system ATPase subunit
MGASNMINAQIFLDEGFTACDAETMERVPALLSNLLKELDYLQTIFLVSHMDTLKSIATRSILIQRGAHASQLQIGDRRGATKSTATKTTVGKAPPPLAPTEEAAEGEIIEAIPLPVKRRGRATKKQDTLQVDSN